MIWKRLHYENKNFLVLVTGETGSSKSYSSVRLSECIESKLHPTYSVKNICMNFLSFMKVLTDRSEGRLKKGQSLVYEELGISADSDEWWSKTNKILKYILQTFRTRNLCVFFTVPDDILIDKKIKSMFHAVMEMQYIDFKTGIAWFKLYKIQRKSSRSRKGATVYYKQYQFFEQNGEGRWEPYKYSLIGVHKPTPWLSTWYEDAREKMGIQLEDEMMGWAVKNKYVKGGMKMTKAVKRKMKRQETLYDIQLLEDSAKKIVANLSVYTDAKGNLLKLKIRKEFGFGMGRMSELSQMVREMNRNGNEVHTHTYTE